MPVKEHLLSMSADQLGRKLGRMVLPSARELFRATSLSRDQFKGGMKELVREGLVDRAELGALVPAVPRYWLTEEGLNCFEVSDEQRSWHGPDAVGCLVQYDMPKIEAVNAVADGYARATGVPVSAVHWVARAPMCAVVEYATPGGGSAYVVVCWASMMDTEAQLCHRLEAVPGAMRERSLEPNHQFFPAGLAVVAASEWGAARALTMACAILRRWVPPSHITGWYHGDAGWHMSDGRAVTEGTSPEGGPRLLLRMSALRPEASDRQLGKKYFDRLLGRVLWAGRAGPRLLELLTLVGEYPVGAAGHYQALAGEASGGKTTEGRMKRLKTLGLVEVVTEKARARARGRLPRGPVTLSPRGQGADRHALTRTGRSVFCHFHGGTPGDLPSRTKLGDLRTQLRGGGVEDRWRYRHEDIVYEVLARFSQKGCPVAPGWQARTTLADGRRIDPDGKVLLCGVWGRRWCFLEVELSDTSYSALKPRCGKYAATSRRDDHPALFVCPDDQAESNLHRAGVEFDPRPRILTTTLRRLKARGVLGNEVWSHYGAPVSLAAPGSGS